MKKLEKIAKILFLFFAVISLGLVTVSCSDDDEVSNEDIWRCKMYNNNIIITLKVDKENNVFYTTVENNSQKILCFTDDEFCKYYKNGDTLYVTERWKTNEQHNYDYIPWIITMKNKNECTLFCDLTLPQNANETDTNIIYYYTFKKQ